MLEIQLKSPPASFTLSVESILKKRSAVTKSTTEGIFGFIALGDTLGLPAETMSADYIKARYGRITRLHPPSDNPYTTTAQRGDYSDDTQLTLATAQGVLSPHTVSIPHIVRAHVEALAQTDSGWGSTTRLAIQHYASGGTVDGYSPRNNPKAARGNGVIMKISPIALWAVSKPERDREEVVTVVHQIARLTHPTAIAAATAVGHVFALIYCLGVTPSTFKKEEFLAALTQGVNQSLQHFQPTEDSKELQRRVGVLANLSSDTPKAIIDTYGGGSHLAVDSAPFSWAFFLRANTKIKGMFDAINAGGDTDSNGAIVGSLIGALHGSSAIPQKLYKHITRGDKILEEAAKLSKRLAQVPYL